ncbi:MAG: tRNA dihydrouridine synthase, partial [Minisyncoccia bacterium]
CMANEVGRAKLMRDLLFTDAERPIVAQLFTSHAEHIERAVVLARGLGFDGVDINMGCPDRAIEKQGAGAALIKNPALAQELIAAAKRGANGLPVSVKTRLGYNRDTLEEWLSALIAAEPAAVTIHARTRKEMSKVPAQWERIARAVKIRDGLKSSALIIGNGDAHDVADAREKALASGADGVMLGRAIFGRPWLFADPHRQGVALAQDSSRRHLADAGDLAPEKRLRVAVEHAKLFEELLGDIKNFAIMKKHFKAYVEGFDGARELRMQLMETENAAEVEKRIEAFLAK